MNISLILVLSIVGCFTVLAKTHTQPEVTILQGSLRGEYKTSRAGKTFASFTKIPYAKPPLEELRFKAPEPAESWTGVYDATQKVPKCIQKDYISHNTPPIEGVEDCLFINVFTPKKKKDKLLPVMVFIPYGGNIAGSSQPERSGPEFFMDRQVVFVSFNYRVGIFGFFSTLNDDSPGNYGPKDQVLALKWVRDNIEHFGGDKNSVTIFGQSAGAGATHHLILSPSSQGLFHRAISESGSAMCLWAKPLDALQQQIFPATGQVVGCDPTNTTAMVECMRKLDAETLMNAPDVFKYFHRDPLIVYTHVVEKRSERNPEPFLERDPAEIILSGNFQKVPWILGTVQNEGDLQAAYFIDSKIREEYFSRFEELASKYMILNASMPSEEVPDFWKQIKNSYFGVDTPDFSESNHLNRYIDMVSDRGFAYGAYQSALLHSMKGHNPIWFYNFNFTGSVSFATSVFVRDTENPMDVDLGVSHCDELIYLFNSPELFPEYEMTPTELQMSKVMITLWTNFAITGNPHKQWQPLPNIVGRNATNKDLHYLDIRGPEHLVLRNDYRRKDMQFWTDSGVFENVPGIQ